ncbi:MAG TPA: type 1 glutamine amidotransferase [Dongiaceae bacterium]|jgi:GMP synthase-like glutamine amidotransferase|nr:type 1 glutamine amidotransferase [Dongiaceae bacterium]
MSHFLIIVPETDAPPALIGEALLEAGHSYDAVYPTERFASHRPLSYPGLPSEPGDYSGLIVMGGPMSAHDTAEHAFLTELMALIRGFGVRRRAVLGVCLGAQVIARAYDGEVFRIGRLEAGYVAMHTTPEAEQDPVFAGATGSFNAFHTHYEGVRNIPGATVLVTGGASPVQAYRVGETTYGVQFHPEVTIDVARDWVRKFGAVFCKDEPRLVTDLDRDFQAYFGESSRLCRKLVQNWCRLG